MPKHRRMSSALLAILYRYRTADVDDVGWDPEQHCPLCARDRQARQDARPATQDADALDPITVDRQTGGDDDPPMRLQITRAYRDLRRALPLVGAVTLCSSVVGVLVHWIVLAR